MSEEQKKILSPMEKAYNDGYRIGKLDGQLEAIKIVIPYKLTAEQKAMVIRLCDHVIGYHGIKENDEDMTFYLSCCLVTIPWVTASVYAPLKDQIKHKADCIVNIAKQLKEKLQG